MFLSSARLRSVMSREIPNVPMIVPFPSRKGIFVVDTHVSGRSGQVSFLHHVDDRLAGGDDALLVVKGYLGALLRVEIEIRLADGLRGVAQGRMRGRAPCWSG